MRSRLAPFLLFVLLIASTVGAAAAARAPETALVARVERNEAIPSFPEGISFTLAATAQEPIERVELLYATAGDPTWRLSVPSFSPGEAIEVAYDVDLQANYLPPGVDVEYRWRLLTGDGEVTETETRTVAWVDSRFPWQTISTPDVQVSSYAGDEAFRRSVLDAAQRTVDRLRQEYGLAEIDPFRIWAYASPADFAVAQAPNSETWIGGTAYKSYHLILLVLPPDQSSEIRRKVPHEVAHQVLFQVSRNPYIALPRWLDEGLAVSYQEVPDPAFPELLRRAALEERLDSIRSLSSSFPYDPGAAVLAYAESLSIVDFIAAEFGLPALRELVTIYDDGITHDDAVQRVLGISLDELDRRWRERVIEEARAAPLGGVGRDSSGSGLDTDTAISLASGTLVMGAVALVAVAAGLTAFRRSRQPAEEDDDWPPFDPTAGNIEPSGDSRQGLESTPLTTMPPPVLSLGEASWVEPGDESPGRARPAPNGQTPSAW